MPIVLAIVSDLLELGFQAAGLAVPAAFFLMLGFLLPLVLWPLVLIVIAVQTYYLLSTRSAVTVALPALIPLLLLAFAIF